MPESSIPPPLPKQSAVGAWIVFGLLVAGLGAGGWYIAGRVKGGSTTPAPASAVASAAASAQALNASPPPAPPPPPPPPPAPESTVEPLASAAADRSGHKATSTRGPGPVTTVDRCASPCEGDTDHSFEATLRHQGQLARRCYDAALSKNSGLQGKLMVGVRVAADGHACSASILSDGLGNAEVNACVTKLFKGATYPAPRGGCADAKVPLNFVAKP